MQPGLPPSACPIFEHGLGSADKAELGVGVFAGMVTLLTLLCLPVGFRRQVRDMRFV